MVEIESKSVASWKNFPWLRHGFSTRQGGASAAYGGKSLNLGWTKEDDPAHVRQNRGAFVQAVSRPGEPMQLVTIRQVHSGVVRVVGEEAFQGTLETSEGKAVLEGDGLVTNVLGVLLAVGTADCVPVLVVDPIHRAVGAFHAGWRGTVAGIVQQGIALMQQQYGSHPGEMMAAVGPSIGACCYAVGEEVRHQFAARFLYAQDLFVSRSNDGAAQLYVDLWEANRRQLIDAGAAPERVTMIGECTACARTASGERRYFSHRAERGTAGRMLNAIGIAR
ncbi:MAG: peptidoglycan editing factor PgeF [Acidobacteria bacterium]|nr:peptidoglycan editing factor PgeF [Acidobacteriota bacterium]